MNQQGVTPLPHSTNKERIGQNAHIPQWALSLSEMEQIDSIRQNKIATCGWEKFLNQELYTKSKQWLAKI